MPFVQRLKLALRSPLLPVWLVLLLLPFGRSSELGTLLCVLGTLLLFAREPHALAGHPGARLLLWLFAAYAGAALLSAVDAVDPGKSWLSVAGYLRYAPFGLYVCFAVRRETRWRALCMATAALVALWALDAWVQAITGWSLGGHAEALRVSGIFGADNLKLGPVLAALAPFVLWSARSLWGRRGLVLAFLFLLGPVLLAGSRAAWLSYALVGAAFAWRESRTPARFAGWCAGAALVAALACVVAWQASPRFHARAQRSLQAFNGSSAGVDVALSGRLDIWRTALAMYAGHPFNGVGVRGFRYAYPDYAPKGDHFLGDEACGAGEGACHAHQDVLEVATETGTLGLVLWLAGVALAWRAWRRVGAAARARAFPATVALAATLFPLNTHLAFYSAWWGLLFWWLLAVWCAALYLLPEQQHDA
ncbi:MAG TPA: O-antigen ligase family protein [Rhodanobacteraceae bacterium]|nr:O-antigen ligase family protein [Rhodanobacteraceae bacterium]